MRQPLLRHAAAIVPYASLVYVTAPDVATGPFRVARALSPDLQPLSYGSVSTTCRSPRLRGADAVDVRDPADVPAAVDER
jgi:hypothetical protein